MSHTLQDLEAARDVLKRLESSYDDYMGNNPDKYTTRIRIARGDVERIERDLLADGLLEPTALQAANMELDKRLPSAKKSTRGEYAGKTYEIHYWQESASLSGKTTRCRHQWRLVE